MQQVSVNGQSVTCACCAPRRRTAVRRIASAVLRGGVWVEQSLDMFAEAGTDAERCGLTMRELTVDANF